MHAVIAEEMLQPLFHDAFIPRIAESTAYQHRSAIADVRSNHIAGQLGTPQVGAECREG